MQTANSLARILDVPLDIAENIIKMQMRLLAKQADMIAKLWRGYTARLFFRGETEYARYTVRQSMGREVSNRELGQYVTLNSDPDGLLINQTPTIFGDQETNLALMTRGDRWRDTYL